MIKDVLVNLPVGAANDTASQYAISICAAFEAHLAGVAFAYEPTPPPTIIGTMPLDYVAAQRAESERAASATVARFDEAVRRAGIFGGSHVIGATIMGAADTFGRLLRRFDLAVIGQSEPDRTGLAEPLIEAAMFESGRPLVVVPYIQKTGLALNRVMVCWDGGRMAARAIGDALPFLERAKQVDLVIVTSESGKSDQIPGADMGQHLARHGIKVEVKRIVSPDNDVPNTLLSYAADNATDFIVMGGYGHSRLREFVLGGVTRSILASMTAPTLLAH